MANKLTRPYTEDQYADFVSEANKNGQRIEFNNESIFALFNYEIVKNGELTNISQSPEYIKKVKEEENFTKKIELQNQINELDLKRIRAIAEPQLKDASSGQTWLEFYTLQIQAIRAEIGSL